MYFREFGIPARIARCYSKDDIGESIEKYNGKKNCYTSVYVFDDLMDKGGKKTDYSSAVINTLWFDFDHNTKVIECLKDVRKLYKKYCKERKIVPRIYFTGGRGFQINIDFWSPLDLPNSLKKESLKKYLMHLKDKYRLKTLDSVCIQNSTSAMRRIYNTQYVSKLTREPIGKWCVQLSVPEMLKLSMEKIMELSTVPRSTIPPTKSNRAQRDFLDFVCDISEVKHTVSNSAAHLLEEIRGVAGFTRHSSTVHSGLIKAPRKCVMKLIELNIDRESSSHTENNVIAMELINAGWSDRDISFVFKSIYNEPAGDWGWYDDDPEKPGRQIRLLRGKGISRYGRAKLKEMGILKQNFK